MPNIKSVKMKIVNWDKEFEKDLDSGDGFLITDRYVTDTKKNKSDDHICSSRYGSAWDDPHPFMEKYSCKCGDLMGRLYNGEICKICGEEVKFVDSNLKITGWLELDDHVIIHPTLFYNVRSIIGKELDVILDFSKRLDVNGNSTVDIVPDKKNPFAAIGMMEFYKRFDEILDFFYKKSPEKKKMYKFIKKHRSVVFQRHIPVYSLLLRPMRKDGEDLSFSEVNKLFSRLSTLVLKLNQNKLLLDTKDIKVLPYLYSAQKIINLIHMTTIEDLSSKHGHIRGSILGGRMNYVARNVIVPNSNIKSNEVILPYLTVLELWKPDIMNIMMRIEKIDMYEAYHIWNYAMIKFDRKVYEYMKYIIHNSATSYVLVNRNPS